MNEVYDSLGLEWSKEGQVVGWVLNGEGDGYIDFGIYEAYNGSFVNGFERNLILDFNVDGVVYDKLNSYIPKFIRHQTHKDGE